MKTTKVVKGWIAVVAITGVWGCSVGPDYVRPTLDLPASYKELNGWKVAEPNDAAGHGDWWTIFGSVELNGLEERATAASPSIAEAEARYRGARASVGAVRAAYFPTISVGAAASRTGQSANLGASRGGGGSTSSVYSLPVDVQWEIDVWGRVRRAVESSEASAQANAADLTWLRLSLQAELAVDYFQLRAVDAEVQLLERTVADFEKSLTMTRNRYASGVVSRADVVQAEAQLASTKAQALDLGVQRAQLEHAIAVLVGEPPSTFSLASASLDATPPPIPVGIPSELLERRPDVASLERQAASANAEIGVAKAAYFPTFSIGATVGYEASEVTDWFSWPSRFWSVGPNVSETIYDGGLRGSQTTEARAGYDASVAAYRLGALTALQEVEDAVAGLRILEKEAAVQAEAVNAAQASVDVEKNRYKSGVVSYLDVVAVQTTALADQRAAVDILGRRMTTTVLLVKALGGGWTTAQLPSADEVSEPAPEPDAAADGAVDSAGQNGAGGS